MIMSPGLNESLNVLTVLNICYIRFWTRYRVLYYNINLLYQDVGLVLLDLIDRDQKKNKRNKQNKKKPAAVRKF